MSTNEMRLVEGVVKLLTCVKCVRSFPLFEFAGEEDIDTAGLCSLSACGSNEIFLAEATPTEWNDFDEGGSALIEQRLAKELGRTDLKIVRLVRTEQVSVSGEGISFQDFRKAFKPPVLIYACVCCVGESKVTSEMQVAEFQRAGGKIVSTGRLELAVVT